MPKCQHVTDCIVFNQESISWQPNIRNVCIFKLGMKQLTWNSGAHWEKNLPWTARSKVSGVKSKCPRFSFWPVFCLNGLTKVERKVSVCPVDRIIKSSERYCHWQAGGCYGFQLEKHSISAVACPCLEKCALFELSLTWGLCSVPLSTPGHS